MRWCNTEALGAPTLNCLPVEKLINVATLPGGSSLYLDLLFLSLKHTVSRTSPQHGELRALICLQLHQPVLYG